VVADRMQIRLPPDLSDDSPFEVVVGMYRPDTGQRLPVLDDQGQPLDDKVLLRQIESEE
jgi:hypothetical protein